MLPGEHEGLLDRVLGAVDPQHEAGDADESGQRRSDQDAERLVIPCLRSRDELSLHLGTEFVAARLAALTEYESAPASNGSGTPGKTLPTRPRGASQPRPGRCHGPDRTARGPDRPGVHAAWVRRLVGAVPTTTTPLVAILSNVGSTDVDGLRDKLVEALLTSD